MHGTYTQILYLLTEAMFLLDIVNFRFPIKILIAVLVTVET